MNQPLFSILGTDEATFLVVMIFFLSSTERANRIVSAIHRKQNALPPVSYGKRE